MNQHKSMLVSLDIQYNQCSILLFDFLGPLRPIAVVSSPVNPIEDIQV